MRREVELSRKRSIRLKAQVDKLQKDQEDQGWSQRKDKVRARLHTRRPSVPVFKCSRLPQVTEEVLSVLRLLSPLTGPEWSLPEPSHGQNQLDVALAQLQNVARKLAMSHTTEVNTKPHTLSRGT